MMLQNACIPGNCPQSLACCGHPSAAAVAVAGLWICWGIAGAWMATQTAVGTPAPPRDSREDAET